ncbi:MAG: hypothetical protein K2P33_02090 [Acutalibacter sp.]|nr:hypothetical protein [Acutalibacter sp.]
MSLLSFILYLTSYILYSLRIFAFCFRLA